MLRQLRTPRTENPQDGSFFKKYILAGLVVLVAAAGLLIPSPYLIERPGPTINTLGDIEVGGETKPMVQIDGIETFETTGELRLLTVSIVGNPENRLGWLVLVPTLFDKTQELVPIEAVYAEGVTADEREERNAVMMQSSQTTAVAAALTTVGMSFESNVTVAQVIEGAPSEDKLMDGDVIRKIDGVTVSTSADLRNQIAQKPIGTTISFNVERDGESQIVEVTTAAAGNQESSIIGVLLVADYEFPIDVQIAIENIGGPSAGLMFALAIYDQLTEEALVSDLSVSGTGTVDDMGNVGAIGGLRQKIWGADRAGSSLFLMPKGNCMDLPEQLPKGLTAVAVDSVADAITAIEQYKAGEITADHRPCDEVFARSSG